MDDLIGEFTTEATGALAAIRRELTGGEGRPTVALRKLHGLKGSAACLGLGEIESLAHRLEDDLCAGVVEGADRLLAALDAALAALAPALRPASAPQPPLRAGAAWRGLEGMARELGLSLGKRIELVATGDDTPLPPGAAARLRAALIALLRNACDHGIETPTERAVAGKPELAVIRLSARAVKAAVAIEMTDDGRGVDAGLVRARSVQLGLAFAAAQSPLESEDPHRMVFEAGLSTAAALTRVSGRGVGLDLVRAEVESMGGKVELSSAAGRGARALITLPVAAARRRTAA